MRWWHIIAILSALFCASAAAQTTQPAPPAWGDTIAQLTRALIDEQNGTAMLSEIVSDDVPIKQFKGTTNDSRFLMQQQTSGLSVVSVRVYAWPTASLAADLSSDAKSCDVLPDVIRRQFLMRDDTDARHANLTAQQWMAGVLQPGQNDVVAMIVLWEKQPITTSLLLGTPPPPPKQPIFVLVKGTKSGDDEDFHITQIVYGDAKQALN